MVTIKNQERVEPLLENVKVIKTDQGNDTELLNQNCTKV